MLSSITSRDILEGGGCVLVFGVDWFSPPTVHVCSIESHYCISIVRMHKFPAFELTLFFVSLTLSHLLLYNNTVEPGYNEVDGTGRFVRCIRCFAISDITKNLHCIVYNSAKCSIYARGCKDNTFPR